MTELRAEVVAALIAGQWFDAAKLDPTTDELGAAGDALGELAKSELQATGHLPPEATVYDLTLDDLEIPAALWSVVGRWKAAPEIGGTRRLGDALKILPAWVVADVLRILAIGGYIPWSEVPEPPPCEGTWDHRLSGVLDDRLPEHNFQPAGRAGSPRVAVGSLRPSRRRPNRGDSRSNVRVGHQSVSRPSVAADRKTLEGRY